MAASIGGGGGQHVHFDGSSADAPQPKKETPKEPAKSILKQTSRLKPEMKPTAGNQEAGKDPDTSTSS